MMKKMFVLLALLCAVFMTAAAEEVYAPSMEEIWTETTLEEFVGYWELALVSSDQPVDMSCYRYLDIAEDGSCSVNIGNKTSSVGFDAAMSQIENGVIYLADENGENGAYYFLFDISLMGCVETLDNPGTISYLTCDRNDEDAYAARREEQAAEILLYAEGAVPAFASQDIEGVWKCWSWTREYGMAIMDPAMLRMTISIDGEQAEIASVVMDEENSQDAQIVASDTEVLLISEDDDPYYVFLRGEDELILLDDPEWPTNALFFYKAERWDREEAAGAFFTGKELGEIVQLTSLDQVVGRWEATHYDIVGYAQPVYNRDAALEIAEDGTLVYYEEGEADSDPWTLSIQDNYLIATCIEGDMSYFLLYDNDVLVEANEGDDFTVSIYYQRSAGE